jgi:E3 ubiquitin-protein ligase HUWE1
VSVIVHVTIRRLSFNHSTRIAIKMSRASEKAKDGGDGKVSQSAASEDEDEDENIDVDDDDREETPDLYRTSALGM